MRTSRDRPLLANSAAMIAQIKSDLALHPPNPARVLRDELRARAGQPAAPDDSIFQLSRTNRISTAGLSRTAAIRSRQPAGRRLAESDRQSDARTMAAGREQRRRRSPRDHRRAGRGFDLGNVAHPPDDERLGGVERREVRSQLECASAGGLDFGRRRRVSRCFPRWCVTTNASAAWSSTPCDWSWPRRGANTSIPRHHYASSIPATRSTTRRWASVSGSNRAFVIPDDWTIEEKAVLRALKKYGAIVADNGNFFSVSVCPDNRFSDNAFDHLSTIDVSNFEVIQTTGPRKVRAPRAPRRSKRARTKSSISTRP